MADDKKTVLVVDDEDDVLVYLKALLADAGYDVVTARNGNEAMEAVKARRPALVSLDISMPEKSGVRFYREMKEDDGLSGIPIVVVTGISNPWEGPSGEGSFGDFLSSRRTVPPPEGYFEKPVDREAYLEKVRALAE